MFSVRTSTLVPSPAVPASARAIPTAVDRFVAPAAAAALSCGVSVVSPAIPFNLVISFSTVAPLN